ncbi:MAG: hypothetical protein ACKO5R_09990 [Planctomycetaceae bacterium]
MSYEVRLREGIAGVVALMVAVMGALCGIYFTPWLWILLPVGLVAAFRLVPNAGRRRIAAIKNAGGAVVAGEWGFVGVADGRLWTGALAPSHVAGFEQRADAPVGEADDAVLRRWKGAPPAFRCAALDALDRVESTTGEKTIRLVLPDRTEELAFDHAHERDAALELLRPARPWTVAETARWIPRFDPLSALVGMPLMAASAALVLAAAGLVPANQLPLLDWQDAAKVRGRARAVAAAWATASQCFRFLLDTLPAAACVAIGIAALGALATLVWASQWARVVDAVWTPPGVDSLPVPEVVLKH